MRKKPQLFVNDNIMRKQREKGRKKVKEKETIAYGIIYCAV